MKTDEVLTLQALKFKELNTQGHNMPGRMVDQLIDSNPDAKEKLRNICAFITPGLFDQVQNLCGLLDLSKRQFVEMALADLVEKSNRIIEQFDAAPVGEEH